VNHHGLEIVDFVVFKYISKSYFKVTRFQRIGCVKNINALQLMNTNIDTDKRCPSSNRVCSSSQPTGSKLPNELVSDGENNNDVEAMEENQNCNSNLIYFNFQSRHLNCSFTRRIGITKTYFCCRPFLDEPWTLWTLSSRKALDSELYPLFQIR